jgi:NADH dehydrogenase
MASVPHIVIIGGGFGGLDAARALARAPVRVTLIDRHNYHLFQPLLYQVATASLSPADIASPIRWVLRRQANVQVLLAEARAIDPDQRLVRCSDHAAGVGPDTLTVPYDYLIVATGARHAYFGHPEWAKRAPGLKTLDDALEIRRQVLLAFEAAEREADPVARARLLTFVVVGGGPTGVELAGALAEIARQSLVKDFRAIHPESARIIVIEGSPHVLAAFPESLRHAALASLTSLGVEVKVNAVVTAMDEAGVTWCPKPAPDAVATGSELSEQRIAAATVLWAAGVAASPLAKSISVPLDRAGRVIAEPTLAVPGRPGIFVVGDVCALEYEGHPLPGVAQVAMQGGTHAARNVLRGIRGESLEPFRYRNLGNMATIGRGSAVADIASTEWSGFSAWLIWLFIHIFSLIGFRNRLAVMGEWAWAYLTFQRRARLITGERMSPGPESN